MPIYEYACPTCEYKFDKLQPMSETGADCPRCSQPAKRAISLFASVVAGSGPGDFDSCGAMGGMGMGAGGCGSACGCAH